jgi:hypothetical protein
MNTQTISATASGFAETAVHGPNNPILKIQIPLMLLESSIKATVTTG